MQNSTREDYKNTRIPVGERVENLLQQMTLEEKVAQTMSCQRKDDELREDGTLVPGQLSDILKHGIGSIQLPGRFYEPRKSAAYANALQKYILENTRLGIPVLIQEECLNGHVAQGATVYPRPIGLAGTWDTDLVEEVFSTIGLEARARGGHQAFTPVLDVARDFRWGRVEETFGEDTYLCTRMGVAAVKGLQGGVSGANPEHIIASPKHFAGYAQAAGGRNFAPTDIPERAFKDQILPPFKAAVMEAGAMGIMPSHAEIDGVPCHGSKRLLTGILRDEWGFEGIVVSDYNDVERLAILHHVVENREQAAVKALEAGLDMDLPSGSAYIYLIEAAKKDKKVENLIDRAVRRILRVKFMLGLFENPYVNPDRAEEITNCSKHKELAKKAADKTVILLKNDNNLLPLDRKKIKKIAVVGPNAHPVHFSYYSPRPNVGISVLDGLTAKVGKEIEILYTKGCSITRSVDAMVTELDLNEKKIHQSRLYQPSEEIESIAEAAEIAGQADVAIVCVGGSSSESSEAAFAKGHLGDRADLDLIGQQNALVKAVLETGTPTIVVLIHGRPLSCTYITEHVPAILEGWYLGQETGSAIADVLFGDVNPGGKLPVTIPRSVGHLPAYYSQKPTGQFKEYLFTDSTPLYPFGYGLSYTTFSYNNLRVIPEKILSGQNAEVSVEITNTGDCMGDEVVQLYIHDKISSVTRPVKELKGFRRVTLKPGETQQVTFTITPDQLSFTNKDYHTVVEPGEFEVMVGTSSVDYMTVCLTVSED